MTWEEFTQTPSFQCLAMACEDLQGAELWRAKCYKMVCNCLEHIDYHYHDLLDGIVCEFNDGAVEARDKDTWRLLWSSAYDKGVTRKIVERKP